MENQNLKHIKIALTGGIGSGKSIVAKIISSYGYPVYDSDARAKMLMESDLTLKNELISIFGENIYFDGKLNRRHLAELVFNSKDNLRKINELVHKAVFADFAEFAKRYPPKLVFMESAIIFENSLEKHFDYVVVVLATAKLRIQRVMQRNGMSPKKILKRIKHQKKEGELKKLADFVINNNENKQPLLPQIEKLINKLDCIKCNVNVF